MSTHDYLRDPHAEGYLSVDHKELYFRRFGDGDDVMLGLHGGPGMPHDYLLPLSRHGSDDLSVVLYDQFGVGRSSRPAPGDFDGYTIEAYREEVEAVRRELDPDRFLVYGQSWGGMLALEYALEYGEKLSGLVLANTLADTASAYRSMRSRAEDLPSERLEEVERHEARRAYDAPAYLDALDDVYHDHVCRLEEYPPAVEHTLENVNTDVYGLMWGPNEYVLTETARLRGWDVRDDLGTIDVPTLVLTGTHDEIDPDIAAGIDERLPDSRLIEFDSSSHMPFWEQPEEHYETVETYLAERLE
ncbi:proline iminopeptidase-family hydrolase [Halorubrum sp. F4]|uniref:proline iminopeptidase-family hydrolase n=1 Tax=Halorubrum sp. F4 TaxID=2989715 RepID=UPI0024811A15|nr:proline iminopeptidase-family hydrolase [Halorubrum sp. F4]